MGKKKWVELADASDRELINAIQAHKDRDAVIALYERYRLVMGVFLNREIANKDHVKEIFNDALFELITKSALMPEELNVSKRLLAMLYTRRLKYTSVKQSESESKARFRGQSTGARALKAYLPELHRHIAELAYQHNCTIPEIADIIGCTTTMVRDCLSYIQVQQQRLEASIRLNRQCNHTLSGNHLMLCSENSLLG